MLEIEFFHDVICSFCFSMFYRLRKTIEPYQNIKVIHRSFALDWEVLEGLVKETSFDFDAWQDQLDKAETKETVLDDLTLVNTCGIQGAPATVINKKHLISGAQAQAVIEPALEQAAEEANITIKQPVTPQFTIIGEEGSACRIVDGNWMCD